MKIRVSHTNGIYDEKTDSTLCEVYCTPELETPKMLIETGWLPTTGGEWYQSKSSRIPLYLQTYSKEKIPIRVSTVGNWYDILEDSRKHYPYLNDEHIRYCLETSSLVVYFEGKAFSVLNILDGIPYISLVIGTRHNKDILRHVVPTMKNVCFEMEFDKPYTIKSDYLYLGEWYDYFAFKSSMIGFEWWDGESWVK